MFVGPVVELFFWYLVAVAECSEPVVELVEVKVYVIDALEMILFFLIYLFCLFCLFSLVFTLDSLSFDSDGQIECFMEHLAMILFELDFFCHFVYR